jgi:Protein of unknown function (DUF533)
MWGFSLEAAGKSKVAEQLPVILSAASSHGILLVASGLEDDFTFRLLTSKIYAVITRVHPLSLVAIVVSESSFVNYMSELRPDIVLWLRAQASSPTASLTTPSPETHPLALLHLKAMIQLARADGELDTQELNFLTQTFQTLGLPEPEQRDLLSFATSPAALNPLDLSLISNDKARFSSLLFDLEAMAKVNGRVSPEENAFLDRVRQPMLLAP